ncbi:hypothetical protein [Halalkalicoccus jeotgali]|uniref:hypothetical protein n=1 Tax=Halalkalicoccus jeotgali TaxID=413810 RepID=UPI001EE64202|nr:hypothetical protein [Halalkalicoccus jeotgali]
MPFQFFKEGSDYKFGSISVDNIVIDGGTWDGTSQPGGQASLSVVRLGDTDGSEIRNAIVQNGSYYGLNIPESNNIRAHNIISRNHYRHGIQPQNPAGRYWAVLQLNNIEVYGNGEVGLSIRYNRHLMI